MTKKLQLHFIEIGTAAVLFVIVALIGLINFRVFSQTSNQVAQTMDFIIAKDDSLSPDPKEIKGNYTDDTFYQSRYFAVHFNENNEVTNVDLSHIITVSEEDAISYAERALKPKHIRDHFKSRGRYYSYTVLHAEKETTVMLMDATYYFDLSFNFLRISIIYGLIFLGLFVLILAALSKKAIEPVIKNIDKQKQFITNAGHELKTPLSIISANTELLEMLNGKNEWTESTLKQVNRLNELIQKLITISRMNEQLDLTLSEVNLTNLLNESIPSFKTIATQQEKVIKTEVAEDLVVLGDESSLEELFNILLDNAIKYCDDQGIIDITANTKGKTVRLMISNTYLNGEGQDYTRFMDRFYRQDSSRNEKKGFGIGLSMAEAICEQMRGKLQISYRGGMISFTATLQKA